MSKNRKKARNPEVVAKNKTAQKKFFMVTMIITMILIGIMYMFFRSMS